ncbi:uncharacterized protein RCC_05156 [Ramularia collo-cygni]|uniref:AB hydrolase-1 domain-containing protein n=1 Tax=Ramularia collo-cygni TaxID=112498 RepID=A0A2D3V3P4_9PEZI|nr:uncharacterized protein RCC_05156 [Ramularia collo-cygni]CZT19307.1 uncharacterized protein RCC_05156 [Ramularia collo-cygni]
MRGHGKSDYPEDQAAYSEAHTVEDIGAILDETCGHGIKAIVGGLSLGGYMSLAFHRAYPEKVTALLIIDTGPGFKKDASRETWNRKAIASADHFDREGLSALESDITGRKRSTHRNAKGLVRAARGMLTQRDSSVIESLGSIMVPSLVVVGANDTPFLAAAEYMAQKIPNASKKLVPNGGHVINIDNPEGFMQAVLPFLEKYGSPRASL